MRMRTSLTFRLLALYWLIGVVPAEAEELSIDRHILPASLQLPVFYIERLVPEQVVNSRENWMGPGNVVSITTQKCTSVLEVLEPIQAPLRLVLLKKSDEEVYRTVLRHPFSIRQTCGSTLEFELQMSMTWIPNQKKVEIRVTGMDQNGNSSGSADWDFQLQDENPLSIDVVVPPESFQSALLDESGSSESPNSCAGIRISSFGGF